MKIVMRPFDLPEGVDLPTGRVPVTLDFDAQGWKDGDRLRIVAMSMAKNTAQFHRLPNGMFGLKEWYPAVMDKKKGKKAEADPAGEAKDDAVNE